MSLGHGTGFGRGLTTLIVAWNLAWGVRFEARRNVCWSVDARADRGLRALGALGFVAAYPDVVWRDELSFIHNKAVNSGGELAALLCVLGSAAVLCSSTINYRAVQSGCEALPPQAGVAFRSSLPGLRVPGYERVANPVLPMKSSFSQ